MAGNANFAVFSVVTRPESGYSNSDQITGGGLSIKGPGSGSFEPVIASISPNSGKWYWEYRAGQGGGSTYGRPAIGTSEQSVVKNEDYAGGQSGQVGVLFTVNNGNKRINGSETSYGNAVSQNDIVQIALDCDNGAVYLGINNTWQNSGNPESGASKTGAALTSGIQNVDIDIIHTRYNGGGIDRYNFGQDDTFGGAISAAGNADGNGFGVFKYAPPTGFLALCTANLSVSSDIDPAGDDGATENPTKQFNAVAYTGDGTTSNAISVGFQPDLVWIKQRSPSADYSNSLVDSSRGRDKVIYSQRTTDEVSTGSTQDVVSFDSNGFTLGTNNQTSSNNDGREFVAWCWKANGGTTASNSDGDITSTVQANTKAGFSIVQFTSNNTANQTVGHGLGAVPKFILVKPLTPGSWSWWTYHIYNGTLGYFILQNGTAFSSGTGGFGAHPTSSVFTMGAVGSSMPNNTSTPVIAYCWADVEGSSKFGTFEGNANADGPFIYTGFRPRMLFVKDADRGENWVTFDSARNTFNSVDKGVFWNASSAESTGSGSGFDVDILSNGFKMRCTHDNLNGSSTYIYGAWGDVPFKYNNTF